MLEDANRRARTLKRATLRTGAALKSRFFDRYIERDGVDDAEALKLYPDAIDATARKRHVELDLFCAAAGVVDSGNRVSVHHVDQVRAGRQHVSPGSEIRLEPFCGRQAKPKRGALPRHDTFGERL